MDKAETKGNRNRINPDFILCVYYVWSTVCYAICQRQAKSITTRGGGMLRIKFERLKRQWSQQELGYRAGMQGADISKIERGWMKPYPSQAKRLAAVLEIPPETLCEPVSSGMLM
jgi:DNA-binding XRE family transcriptional regulator